MAGLPRVGAAVGAPQGQTNVDATKRAPPVSRQSVQLRADLWYADYLATQQSNLGTLPRQAPGRPFGAKFGQKKAQPRRVAL